MNAIKIARTRSISRPERVNKRAPEKSESLILTANQEEYNRHESFPTPVSNHLRESFQSRATSCRNGFNARLNRPRLTAWRTGLFSIVFEKKRKDESVNRNFPNFPWKIERKLANSRTELNVEKDTIPLFWISISNFEDNYFRNSKNLNRRETREREKYSRINWISKKFIPFPWLYMTLFDPISRTIIVAYRRNNFWGKYLYTSFLLI